MTYDLMCATFNLSNFLFAFLLALTGVLCVVVCVLSLMLHTRHKADVRRLEKYVYVKETWTKTSDCAKNTENKEAKNTAKNAKNSAQKKSRHDKKNKQNAAKSEGGK